MVADFIRWPRSLLTSEPRKLWEDNSTVEFLLNRFLSAKPNYRTTGIFPWEMIVHIEIRLSWSLCLPDLARELTVCLILQDSLPICKTCVFRVKNSAIQQSIWTTWFNQKHSVCMLSWRTGVEFHSWRNLKIRSMGISKQRIQRWTRKLWY
jgi:hypothetical protein